MDLGYSSTSIILVSRFFFRIIILVSNILCGVHNFMYIFLIHYKIYINTASHRLGQECSLGSPEEIVFSGVEKKRSGDFRGYGRQEGVEE